MDREKVIKGVEVCQPSVFKRRCDLCPYREEMNCDYVLWHDALELLKSQPENVLCKDCKWFEVHPADHFFGWKESYWCNNPRCTDQECIPPKDPGWFCADGERKSDDA